MFDGLFYIAFIGPGGPEFLVVLLVLLMMFGAKDAPRILRKLNEIISQIRNTAEGFKREVMYADFNADSATYTPSNSAGEADYNCEEDGFEDDDAEEEGFEGIGEDLESQGVQESETELEQESDGEVPGEEGDDVSKA